MHRTDQPSSHEGLYAQFRPASEWAPKKRILKCFSVLWEEFHSRLMGSFTLGLGEIVHREVELWSTAADQRRRFRLADEIILAAAWDKGTAPISPLNS
jgi:hypothetical protein